MRQRRRRQRERAELPEALRGKQNVGSVWAAVWQQYLGQLLESSQQP